MNVFYIFQAMKNFLILGVENFISRKSYVVFRVDREDHLRELCNVIEMHNPKYEAKNDIQEYIGIRNKEIHNYTKASEEGLDHQLVVIHEQEFSHKKPPKEYDSYPLAPSYQLDEKQMSWEEDIKFISYDPKKGNCVNENGSIYMYTAQQIAPAFLDDYNHYTDSEGSSVELRWRNQ